MATADKLAWLDALVAAGLQELVMGLLGHTKLPWLCALHDKKPKHQAMSSDLLR